MEISLIQNLNFLTLFIIPLFILFYLIIFHKIVSNKYVIFLTHFIIFLLILLIFINNYGSNIFIYLFTFQFIFLYIYIRDTKIDSSRLIKTYFFVAISIILSLQISTNIYNNNKASTDSDRNYKVLFPSQDNFGDTIKLAVSLEFIFDRSEVKDIKGINQKFYLDNPYFIEHISLTCKEFKETPQCSQGIYKNTPRHYGLPPLYLSTIVVFGYFLKFFNNVFLLITFLSFSMSLLAYMTLKKYFFENRYLYIFIILSSFPFYFAIQRGNFISIIVFIILMNVFYKKYFKESLNFYDLFLLSIIINLRPNLILIVPLFLYKDNIILFFKNSLKLGISILSIFFLCLKYLSLVINNYSIEVLVKNFLLYADELINQYVSYGGDGFNSSLFAFLLMVKESFAELFFNLGLNIDSLSREILNELVFIMLITICLYVYYLFVRKKINLDEAFIILLISSLIISPKIADYYLTLLLIPLFLYLYTKEKNRQQLIIQFFIFFVMLPKPHSFIEPVYGVSLGLFFNCLSLLFIIYSILFEKNYEKNV